MMRVLFLAGLAVTASASVLPNTPSSLLSRQTSPLDPNSFPTQCQSTCTAIVNTLNSCTSAACICSSTNGKNMEACMDCLVGVDPEAAEKAEAQSVLNDYNSECEIAGINVPTLSLTASGAAATATSAAASGTATSSAIGVPTFSSLGASSQTTVGGSTPTSTTAAGTAFGPSTTGAGSSPSTTSAAAGSSSSSGTNPFAKSAAGKMESSRMGWMVLVAGLAGALMV